MEETGGCPRDVLLFELKQCFNSLLGVELSQVDPYPDLQVV